MFQWILSNFLTFLTTFSLSVFVFFSNRKSKINKIFCLYSLSISWWSFFTATHAFTNLEWVSLLSVKLLHFSVPLIPILFFLFCVVILDSYKEQKNKLFIGYFISAILIILDFTTNLIVLRVRPKLGYHYFMDAGLFYPLLILYFAIYAIMSLYYLFKASCSSSGSKRNQLRYLFVGSLLGYSFGLSCFFPVYNITLFPYPYGSYAISVYVIIISYAILRYRLMDITVAISRTTIFLIVYTPILGLPFLLVIWLKSWLMQWLGQWWWVSPLVLMFSLATIGPFIYIFLQRKAEERLLKEQRHYQNTLMQASLGMTRIRDLKKLLRLIVHIVSRAVRLNFASIYLVNKENTHYTLEALRTFKDKECNVLPQIEISAALVKYLSESGKSLVLEEMKRRQQDNPGQEIEALKNQMLLLNASVIIPSFISDKLLGFMVLGDKLSGRIYSEDDLRVFTVLANQAALAIENARFFEDAKEMQEQISQAEKMATIGTMADGLSHQINNRFYALSLIAGDTLDTVKLTDIRSYGSEQRELLSQIKYALERIQSNVVQGGEIVKGMLKYTRKGEEGFQAVRLDDIISSTLEMVQYKIRLSEIDILRDYPKDAPLINGNLTQLQEVFFNLIDNANDAMMERKDILKEAGYRGRIRIFTESSGNGYLKINVEDNGIGAKTEDLKKMFTPFFTTKVSSRKGTGLGLYVIKKIITSNHYGKINLESVYKQGTRFILELPIHTAVDARAANSTGAVIT